MLFQLFHHQPPYMGPKRYHGVTPMNFWFLAFVGLQVPKWMHVILINSHRNGLMLVLIVTVLFCLPCGANPTVLQLRVYHLCHFLSLLHVEFPLCTSPSTIYPYAPLYTSNECKNWLQRVFPLPHTLSKAHYFINECAGRRWYMAFYSTVTAHFYFIQHIYVSLFSLLACECNILPKTSSNRPNNQQHTSRSATFLKH